MERGTGGDGGRVGGWGGCLVKAQSKEGRQVGRGEVSAFASVFYFFIFFIYLGGEERENKSQLRWHRA